MSADAQPDEAFMLRDGHGGYVCVMAGLPGEICVWIGGGDDGDEDERAFTLTLQQALALSNELRALLHPAHHQDFTFTGGAK